MGFGETFLAKRHAAGREEGLAEARAELLKFLKENPNITTDQLKDRLRNGDAPSNGKKPGKGRRD